MFYSGPHTAPSQKLDLNSVPLCTPNPVLIQLTRYQETGTW